jgi:hypothetical protein
VAVEAADEVGQGRQAGLEVVSWVLGVGGSGRDVEEAVEAVWIRLEVKK